MLPFVSTALHKFKNMGLAVLSICHYTTVSSDTVI